MPKVPNVVLRKHDSVDAIKKQNISAVFWNTVCVWQYCIDRGYRESWIIARKEKFGLKYKKKKGNKTAPSRIYFDPYEFDKHDIIDVFEEDKSVDSCDKKFQNRYANRQAYTGHARRLEY